MSDDQKPAPMSAPIPKTIGELIDRDAPVSQLTDYIDYTVRQNPLFQEMAERLDELELSHQELNSDERVADFLRANTNESCLARDLQALTDLFMKSGCNFTRAFLEAKQFMRDVR